MYILVTTFASVMNVHNSCRYWADSTAYIFHEGHTQLPQRLNVWAGIVGHHIVDPLFLQGSLTAQMYLELVEDTIDPVLTDIIENDHNYRKDMLIFQQDGAPPPVRQYFDQPFPEHWFGKRALSNEHRDHHTFRR